MTDRNRKDRGGIRLVKAPTDKDSWAIQLVTRLMQSNKTMLEALNDALSEIGDDAIIPPTDERPDDIEPFASIAAFPHIQRLYTLETFIEKATAHAAKIHAGVQDVMDRRLGSHTSRFSELLAASEADENLKDIFRQALKGDVEIHQLDFIGLMVKDCVTYEVCKQFPEICDCNFQINNDWTLTELVEVILIKPGEDGGDPE